MEKITDWIFLKNSKNPWKTTTIIVWVHGNELSWVNAMDEILKDIEITSGKVYFIYANLKALEINNRIFEKNLNRCFLENNTWSTYEDKRAIEITPYLRDSDYLLDVHNTIGIQNSIPFLISEHKDLWKYFDVDLIISWFDDLHPGWSDGFMNTIGKIWLCLESGNIYDPKWPGIARNWIINFLKFTWNIKGKAIIKENQEFINFDKIYKNETASFKFSKEFADFERINIWQILAYDWWKTIISDREWYIVFSYNPKNIWDECFCIGKSIN